MDGLQRAEQLVFGRHDHVARPKLEEHYTAGIFYRILFLPHTMVTPDVQLLVNLY